MRSVPKTQAGSWRGSGVAEAFRKRHLNPHHHASLYIKYFRQRAIDQTVEWLDRDDIPYWDLYFMKDKAAVGANLYIDDSPDNVRKLRAGDDETIIFTNSTNRGLEGLRADSWLEVEPIVFARMEEWKANAPSGGLSGR